MEMTETTFDFEATYTADGYGGVAWRVTGYEEVADEDTVWSGYMVRTGKLVAHMVGDDRDFTFDEDELTELDEDDYCHECGQVGCTADGR